MSTQILMPALSPTMEEGKLAKWHVKEGDTVKAGDVLADIETDKATMEFEAIDEGRIAKILVPEGAEGVKVNAPIAVLEGEGAESTPPADIPSSMQAIRAALAPASAAPVMPAPTAPHPAPAKSSGVPSAPQGSRIFASPLAKRIAAQLGTDLSSLHGSGPRGRIVKSDVEAATPRGSALPASKPQSPAPAPRASAASADSAPAPAPGLAGIAPLPDARLFYQDGTYDSVPNDSIRKTIARRLASAKTLIPHYYLTIECDIGALMQIRARLNEKSPAGEGAYKLSVNDFIVKAAAGALMKHPDVNASWTDQAILKHKHSDIGIAVDLNPGLITPIVFRAETKGLAEISNEVKSLADRAKHKKLKPSDYEGGGFSISNLGMFGVKQFTAIVNPPQSAILAVGAGEDRAVVRNGQIAVASMLTLTMSCDHRVIDGATGARFLQTLKSFIEEPASMLL